MADLYDLLQRNSIGFLSLHRDLDTGNMKFPFYDIHYSSLNGEEFEIQMALAGYKSSDIRISVKPEKYGYDSSMQCHFYENAKLIIETVTQESNQTTSRIPSYKGISKRSFTTSFVLASYVEVLGAHFDNGLLCVQLERVIPVVDTQIRIVSIGEFQPAPKNVEDVWPPSGSVMEMIQKNPQ